jgi:hypothetical protein
MIYASRWTIFPTAACVKRDYLEKGPFIGMSLVVQCKTNTTEGNRIYRVLQILSNR